MAIATSASSPSTRQPWLGVHPPFFIVNRPRKELGFRLERHEVEGRSIRYTTKSYAVDRPEGGRYGGK